MRTAVYIDDTGTSGLKSKSKYDSKDSKSWFALILSPQERIFANEQMKDCLNELKSMYNAEEFHFSDIFGGRNEFKKLNLQDKLRIFWLFSEVHREMQYPILMQTFSQDEYSRNKITMNIPQEIDNFKLNNASDFALFNLLLRIKNYFTNNSHLIPIEIIIDEGRQKKNTTQNIELYGDILLNKTLLYKSSKEEPLLQLVDFVAYCLNRHKWILQNNSKKPIDIEFLEICSNANFNVLNMKKHWNRIDGNMNDKYDEILDDAYSKNGIYPLINLEDYLNQIKNNYR